jgi:hypothetical protein
LHALAVIAGFLAPGISESWAQERTKVSFSAPASISKFTRQHSIDVDDVPGHQVRIFELNRNYGDSGPVIAGVRVKETWTRGMTDYTELNGPGVVYVTYVMENGDRIYARGHITAISTPSGEGKFALKNLAATNLVRGTGKFKGIQGVVRGETVADPKAGINQSSGEMEYWFEK